MSQYLYFLPCNWAYFMSFSYYIFLHIIFCISSCSTAIVTASCHFSAVTNTSCSGEKWPFQQTVWMAATETACRWHAFPPQNFKWCYHAHLMTGTPLLWTLKVIWLNSESALHPVSHTTWHVTSEIANPLVLKCV